MEKCKHPNDMTKDELLKLVWDMSLMGLELAEHLEFTLDCLKVQYRKKAYQRAIGMACEIYRAWEYERPQGNCSVAVFGVDGLQTIKGDFSQLMDGSILPRVDTENKPINLDEFEQVFQEVEESLITDEEVLEQEKALQYFRQLTNEKNSKDHVDIKVKTLRKALFKMECIQNLAKTSRALVGLLQGEIQKQKEHK